MSPIRALLPSLLLALPLSACMTFEVGADADITQNSRSGSEIVHGSIYGFRWRPYHVQKCDESALALVEFNYNWIELLASVATVGLYVPQTVEWWCEDGNMDDDEDEPGLSRGAERRNDGAP